MGPLLIGVLERIFPDNASITGDAALDVICCIFTVSIGLCILFNMNASSGGLDIAAKIMNRFLRMDLGRAMSVREKIPTGIEIVSFTWVVAVAKIPTGIGVMSFS